MLRAESLILPLAKYNITNSFDYIDGYCKDTYEFSIIGDQLAKLSQQNSANLRVVNKKNAKVLFKFLNKIYTPIRYSYIWDIKILTTFVKIIKYLDLPYNFDLKKKFLWRYSAKPYGAFFDKKKRSYVLFFSTGLKKNIGLLMQFLINYPSKSNLLHTVDWHKFSFLFKKTLNISRTKDEISLGYDFLLNKNYFPVNNFYFNYFQYIRIYQWKDFIDL